MCLCFMHDVIINLYISGNIHYKVLITSIELGKLFSGTCVKLMDDNIDDHMYVIFVGQNIRHFCGLTMDHE